MDDDSMILSLAKFFFVLALVLSPFGYLIYRAYQTEERECAEAGGSRQIIGHHWQPSTVMVGKIATVQNIYVADYACVQRQPERAP